MKFQRTLCSYKGMTKRNIKVYLKDKTAIIFSMMTQIIILGLYLLFLKQNYVDSMTSMLDGFNIKTEDNLINALVNSWLVSGVIGTSVVTVAMNSLSVMISDKQNKIDYDYNASSVKGSTVVLSYFSGAVINTIVISAILLTAGIAFSCISGSSFPEFRELLKLYGLVILGSVSAVLILMFVASFFKKEFNLCRIQHTYFGCNRFCNRRIHSRQPVFGRSSDICKSYPRLTHCGYDKKCACQSVH